MTVGLMSENIYGNWRTSPLECFVGLAILRHAASEEIPNLQ